MITLKTERNETGGVTIELSLDGSTHALIDELGAGAAHAVMLLCDGLGGQDATDDLPETLTNMLAAAMHRYVGVELAARSGQAVEDAEDA